MKRATVLLAIICCSGVVAADDEIGHTHATLPSFKLEGGPGKSSLDVGLDIAVALDRATDLQISPTFKATASDGVTTLLSTDGSSFTAGGAWQFGFALTVTTLPDLSREPIDLVPRDVRVSVMETCRNECDAGSSSDFCTALDASRKHYNPKLPELKTAMKDTADAAKAARLGGSPDDDLDDAATAAEAAYKAALHEVDIQAIPYLVETVDPLSVCKSQQKQYANMERDASLQLPDKVLSAGLLVGATNNKWLDPSSTDPMLFKTASKKYPQVTLAGSYLTIDPKRPITKEVSLRFDSSWQSSGKTAKWCSPAGMVSRPDGSGSDPAQICDEQPLGKPKAMRSLRAAAYVGVIDRRAAGWRFALGPTIKYTPVSKADDAYEIGGENPIYLRMSIIKQSLSAVVRLTPTFTFSHASDGTDDERFTITFAILGDRSLFANALQ